MAIIIQDPSATMGFSTMQNGIYHLRGIVKHYDWGGFSFIPSLLDLENTGERPFAEYWLGIHPLGSALVDINSNETKLSKLTPDLPFLLKVLDVKEMLSIQVHPTKEGAESGFEEEEKAGVSIDSPLRNYKDKNHKPELMVALSEFWLLHGFKPEKELVFTLLNVVELRDLLPVFNKEGYEGLYRHVMQMSQEEVNRILQPLISNLSEQYNNCEPEKNDEDFWVSKAIKLFCPPGHIDRGIFSIYLMNLVKLDKGDAIFQSAGLPHAYLEGVNVEIMANSDNVLRGGLTNKHIAVEELLKHIKCEPTFPQIIKASDVNKQERSYEVNVSDFNLSILDFDSNETIEENPATPTIFLSVQGPVTLISGKKQIQLKKGTPSALVLPGNAIRIKGTADSLVFKAYT